MIHWNELTAIEQLDRLDEQSAAKPVLIYKHSTSCSISSMALGRVERAWKEESETFLIPYYLDLLAHRDVSNEIAQRYSIKHESPQVLIIKEGRCVYSESHSGISMPAIMSHLLS